MKKRTRFAIGNYVERGDGAIYLKLDDVIIYFNDNKVIAVIIEDVAYRSQERDIGVNYRRVRTVLNNIRGVKIVQIVSQAELNMHLETALIRMGSKLIDTKLEQGTSKPVLS